MIIWILRSRFTISTWHSTQMTKRLMSQPHSIKLQMKLKNLKIFFFRLEYMICQKPIHNPFLSTYGGRKVVEQRTKIQSETNSQHFQKDYKLETSC